MEFSKKQPALLYLDKNGFYFYASTLPSMVSLAFLETSVKDMDVINPSSIMNQISTFVAQYQIPPSFIMIILSPNITFEKDIVGLSSEAQEENVNAFLDTIPFESVISKSYPIDKGVKVIGANEDLYQELKISFEKVASGIESVIPYQMLGNDQSLIRNFTTDSAQQLLKHSDHLKQYSMLTIVKEKIPMMQDPSLKSQIKPKQNKVRLFVMAGVFAILFIILGIMIMRM